MTADARALAQRLDHSPRVDGPPEYPGALNGLPVDPRGPDRGIAAAVDASRQTIQGAADAGANFLIVHHGLFWGGAQRLTGSRLERIRLLVEKDVAVYSAHLPLDSHPEVGNNMLLARELGLVPTMGFASYQGVTIGVAGEADCSTQSLVEAANTFATRHQGTVRSTSIDASRLTRRWAICTGAGASSDTLREAEERSIDTLIVGEGPHHTAVEAQEQGIAVIYAGHYATETLGVCAVAERLARDHGLSWEFISAPTGL
jgi:dinuclear metal center YbgI/SA1388 family protein